MKQKSKIPPKVNKVDVITPIVQVIDAPAKEGDRHDKSMSPTTTEQEDISTQGQRKVNLIWERTQALIAILVVFTAMFAAVWVVVVDRVIGKTPSDASLASAWTIIATAIGLVVGFYFSRTNHAAIGGVGKKPPEQEYEGR